MASRSLRRFHRYASTGSSALSNINSKTKGLTSMQRRFLSTTNNNTNNQQQQIKEDLDHAVHLVESHDPAGYLPGRLLPNTQMQTAYFAVRSFWVETGLRFGSTARVNVNATPAEHLEWWQTSLDELYKNSGLEEDEKEESDWQLHPTLRLLRYVIFPQSQQSTSVLSKSHLDDVLQGRRNDLDLNQYPTLRHLEDHAALSCGSLSQLVLESGHMTIESNPIAHQAARLVGMGHGITNALRTSIPVISTTGKLIVPKELCEKYGVNSPRYLLSALGQGDIAAKEALNQAVQEIALRAQQRLDDARALRDDILKEEKGDQAVKVLLPALASETFLQRLAESDYDLTDRNLRNVGTLEHWQCASRMILAYYQQTY